MLGWLKAQLGYGTPPQIPADLWNLTLRNYPFLTQGPHTDMQRLRQLCSMFLQEKEFHGAHGLIVTDEIAIAIAAQACLPILNLGPTAQALAWYADFVGIVIQPGEVVARREEIDEAGVAHHFQEILSGEAMEGGPIMLNWPEVRHAGESADRGYNLVIHEFTHKLDMRDGQADGCPPLRPGFLGQSTTAKARALWFAILDTEYQRFREQLIKAERFSAPAPWLDAYGAKSMSEFFAVTSEAFHVNRPRFTTEFPPLVPLFDAFFNPGL